MIIEIIGVEIVIKKKNEQELKKFPIGGVDIPSEKVLTSESPVKEMPLPERVIIPLKQHIGLPGELLVKEGDYVKRGQQLTENAKTGISARIHASISGKVVAIEERKSFFEDTTVKSIIIEKDDDSQQEIETMEKVSEEELEENPLLVKEIVRKAGIVGMGGAGFPTHVKLVPPPEKPINTILINGAECEPYMTVDDRLMREETEKLFRGLDLIRKAVGAEKGIVGCEANKPEALKQLRKEAKNWDYLEADALDTRYPHGAEKHLIQAILNREVPVKGLPMDVGVIVNNVQTAVAIAEAVDNGKNLIERVITVSGRGLAKPANLKVPVGTTIKDIIDYCGGIQIEENIPVLGGPMTGYKIEDQTIPVTKTSIGIVILSREEYDESETRVCIRCGKCVDVCPVYITPNRITDFINRGMYDEAERLNNEDCIECGACAFTCPSKRPLLRWLRKGKAVLQQQKYN